MLIPYLRSLFRHPTCIHGIFSGELHLRGRFIPGGVTFMSAWDSLDESHCQQGGEFMTHLPLHLGVSDVRCWFFLLTRGNWVCTHLGWAFAYCEGMHFGWVCASELSHRLCRAFASFWRSRCFCFVLPLHDCVEPCLFLEGSCFGWSAALSSYPCLRGPILWLCFSSTKMIFPCFCLALGHLVEFSSFLFLLWLSFPVSRLVLYFLLLCFRVSTFGCRSR